MILICALSGYYLATVRGRSCHCCFVSIHGLILFFLAPSIMMEGSLLLQIDKIDAKAADHLCSMSPYEVKKMHGKFLGAFMSLAKNVDEVSNGMMDTHMCTDKVCPCLDYKASYDGATTKDLYKALDQGKLAERHRANTDPFNDIKS